MSGRGKSITAQERDYIVNCYKNFEDPETDRSLTTLTRMKAEAMHELASEMQPKRIPKDDITHYCIQHGGPRGHEVADEILRIRWIVAKLVKMTWK